MRMQYINMRPLSLRLEKLKKLSKAMRTAPSHENQPQLEASYNKLLISVYSDLLGKFVYEEDSPSIISRVINFSTTTFDTQL